MRTAQSALLGFTTFASLSCAATISWTGTAIANATSKPYGTCNGTEVGPTGPTGTSWPNTTVAVSLTSKAYTYSNGTAVGPSGPTGTSGTNTTAGASSTSKPYPSSNGTSVRPTGPTGTAPGNSTTSTRCRVTTTSTSYVYTTFTPFPLISTVTVLGSGPIIYGGTLTPSNGTATAVITDVRTSTLTDTLTFVSRAIPTTTVGNPTTITVPPPSGFLPVQSTLPNATYNYQNPCNVSTATTTSTVTLGADGATTTTLTGTVLYFPNDPTVYTALSDFTNYSIIATTTTFIETTYSASTTTTLQETFTETVTATTAFAHPACATNNFADSVVVDYLPQQITFFDYQASNQSFSGLVSGPTDPYTCCAYAFEQNADVWTYAVGIGCAIVTGTDGQCVPEDVDDTVEIDPDPGLGGLKLVVGNAACGRFTKSRPRL